MLCAAQNDVKRKRGLGLERYMVSHRNEGIRMIADGAEILGKIQNSELR